MTQLTLVPTAQIENELNRIWEGFEGSNKTRACLFNLLFFTQRNARVDYIRRIALNVIEKFPARVIMVIVDPAVKEDFLSTKISVLAPNKGEPDIACDWIEIETSVNMLERASFVVLPHILPDLPLYVIQSDDPTHPNPILSQVRQFTNRFIFDSESAENLSAFSQALLDIRNESHVDIADLNWARTEPWRNTMSSVFNLSDRLEQLKKTKRVEISYNATTTNFFCHLRIQALYLQAWLASRLEWKFIKASTQDKVTTLHYANNGADVQIVLSPESKATCYPGMVLSLDILSQDQYHYSFAAPVDSPECIKMVASNPTTCELPSLFIFPKAEFGQSLVREICHPGTSKHYLGVLKILTQIGQHVC